MSCIAVFAVTGISEVDMIQQQLHANFPDAKLVCDKPAKELGEGHHLLPRDLKVRCNLVEVLYTAILNNCYIAGTTV